MSKNIFLLALLIRLLIIPFFYHPDIKSTLFHTQYLGQGIFDIYSFLEINRQQLPYNNIFVYLPLTYIFLGSINIILSSLYPQALFLWLSDWSFFQNNNPHLPFILLILKIPYLFFELATAWLLYRIFKNKKLLYYWLFNPIVIYLVYIQGNFDIIPTFFTVACWYFLSKQKNILGYLCLGLGIALKIYPILFLPFYLFRYSPSVKKLIYYSLISLFPLFISVVPFLTHSNFYNSFLGSGLTQKLLEFKLLSVPVFPVFYLIILLNFLFSHQKYFEKSIFYLFLIFVILVNFHPQWLIWFFPFITPYFISRSKYILFIILFLCLVYVFLINDNFLFWAHLTPVDWEFTRATSPYQLILLKTPLNPTFIQVILKYLIVLFSIFFYINEKKSLPGHH